MPDFHVAEDIDKHYGRLIKDAGDDTARVGELRLEQSEARAEFYRNAAQASQRQVWVNDAFAEFPDARHFAQMVTGSTVEEIKASAKAVHEQVQALRAPAPPATPPPAGEPGGEPPLNRRAAARAAYGSPAGGQGTDPADADRQKSMEREVHDILNKGNAVPQHLFTSWAQGRFREARHQARVSPSFHAD